MLYKLIDNETIEKAPKFIIDEEKVYANPTAETLLAHGYLPMEEVEKPEKDGFYYTLSYNIVGDVIKQVWSEHEIPAPVEEPQPVVEEPVEENVQEEPEVEPVNEEPEDVIEE